MIIKVGSRDSKLAIIQSKMVIDAIKKYNSDISVELITMKTTGDMILDKTLDKVGGKGLFVKELDKALMDNTVDITVHSFKDMPMDINENLPIVAVSKREDPRDVLILPLNESELNDNLPIGCSSLRRKIQLEKIYPNMKIKPIRGNIQTRLQKLDSGEYSALVLAYAGIKRLGLQHRVSRIFSMFEILPATCQGMIVVQGTPNFDKNILSEFNDTDATLISIAERSFVKTLDGGCSSPISAFARIKDDELTLIGMYVDSFNNTYTDTIVGNKHEGETLGIKLANLMISRFNKK